MLLLLFAELRIDICIANGAGWKDAKRVENGGAAARTKGGVLWREDSESL